MKRIYLILLATLLSMQLLAQVSIGTGTNTSTYNGPLNPFYGYSYYQTIYTADMINASGDIIGLKYTMADENEIPNSDDNLDVWIGHTQKSSYNSSSDWIDVSTLTQVMTDGSLNKVGQDIIITFSEAFTYNGTDNLVIAINAKEPGYDADSNKFYYSGESDDPKVCMYKNIDGSVIDIDSPTLTGTQSPYYANVTLFGITQGCPYPTELNASEITTNSAQLSWTENGTATTWNIKYGEAGFSDEQANVLTGITDNPYTLNGLSYGTNYEFYVQADCGSENVSPWQGPFQFTTNCLDVFTPAYVAPLTTSLPNCWSEADNGSLIGGPSEMGSSSWRTGVGFVNSDGESVYANSIALNNNTHKDWLITPTFDLSGGDFELEVLTAVTAYHFSGITTDAENMGSDDAVYLLISEDDGASWTNLTTWNSTNQPAVSGTEEVFSLSAYSGNVKFAIFATDGTVDDDEFYDFHLGHFEIRNLSACPQPSLLSTNNLMANSAQLAWVENGTSTSWNVEYGETGFTQGSGTNVVSNETTLNIEGLTPETSYTFYVQAICSESDLSEWAGPFNFVTLESCPTPTSLSAYNVTGVSADLFWVVANGSTQWNVEYGAQGFEQGTGTFVTVDASPFNLTGLSPATAYDFYVRTVCSDTESSDWAGPFSFETTCATYTPPYNAVFENNPPTCWEEKKGGNPTTGFETSGYGNWRSDRSFTNLNGDIITSNAVNMYENNLNEWIVSPPFELSGGVFELKTIVALTNWKSSGVSNIQDVDNMGSDDEVQLLISENNGTTWTNVITWNVSNEPAVSGTEYVIDLSAYTGEVVFAMYATDGSVDDNEDYDFHIGHFELRTLSSCPKPSNLLANDVTASSANLSWTQNGTVTGWNIEYGESGFTQGEGTTVTVSENPYALNNLTAETSYAFYVQAICSESDLSEWAGPYVFTTLESCPAPSGLSVDNITANSAQLAWVENGASTNWSIEYGESGFTQGEGTIVTVSENPYVLSGLNSATTYSFYVKSDCSDSETSDWSEALEFTTDCDIYSAPYNTTFENNPPLCWVEMQGGSPSNGAETFGTAVWRSNRGFTDANGNSVNSNAVNLYKDVRKEWLITPTIDLSNGVFVLKTKLAVTNYAISGVSSAQDVDNMGSDDKVQLLVSGNDGVTWAPLMTWDASNQPAVTGTEYTIDLSNYTTNVKFAFFATDGTVDDLEDYDFHIGSFEIVAESEACETPEDLSATEITTNSAKLSWTSDGTTWNLEYGVAGFTQGTGNVFSNISMNPYTLNGLESQTEYEFYVQNSCANSQVSEWAGPYSFTTLLSIGVENLEAASEFKYFPNPVKDVLRIEAKKQISKVEVYNVNKAMVYNQVFNTTQATVELSNLPSGTYLVRAIINHKVEYFKVIKM